MKIIYTFILTVCIVTITTFASALPETQSSYGDKVSQGIVKRLHYHIMGNEKVLDLGCCGDGKQSAAFLQYFPHGAITGVDISSSNVELAKDLHPKELYPSLTFVTGDAQNLHYQDDFTIILSVSVLHLTDKPEQVIAGIYAALKNNGIALTQIPLGYPIEFAASQRHVTQQSRWSRYFDNFSDGWNVLPSDQYTSLFRDVGFEVVRSEILMESSFFETEHEFKSFLKRWYQYLSPIPDELKSHFLDEVVASYLENLVQNGAWSQGEPIPWIVKRLELEVIRQTT